MRVLVGIEEPVDPAVVRRPLPFSRAWLAAFVLGVIAVGWMAVLAEFDTRTERAHVDQLDAAVRELEKAVVGGEGYLISRSLEDLVTVTAGRKPTGAEDLDRMWVRIDLLTKRAQDLTSSDMEALSGVVDDLRAVSTELDDMVTVPGLAGDRLSLRTR